MLCHAKQNESKMIDVNQNIPEMISDGEQEVMARFLCEYKSRVRALEQKKLEGELKFFFDKFSYRFFGNEHEWEHLSHEKKEAFYELAARSVKKKFGAILGAVILLNGTLCFAGSLADPLYFIFIMFNILLWPLCCPSGPFSLSPVIKLLINKNKIMVLIKKFQPEP